MATIEQSALTIKTHKPLLICLGIMGFLVLFGLIAPRRFLALMEQPDFYMHAKFVHILSVTVFFANTIIGTLWEVRSLLSKRTEIIRYTYQTVVWLDAMVMAPLIIVAVVSGIMMGTTLGGVWTIGWLSIAFVIFLFAGLVWIFADIPTQYKIDREFRQLEDGAKLPERLHRLLWMRMGVNFMGIAPLLVVFYLMIHKPEIPPVSTWF